MKNLDYIAAKSGNEILNKLNAIDAKELEKLINDTLLVLHGEGVYACILYLYARDKKKDQTADKIVKELLSTAGKALQIDLENLDKEIQSPEDALNLVNEKICNNTDFLFLVKDLWERTLIYARYGAKAKVKE
ncbi:hypothetical protein [Kosmotoga olearia]|jgi:glycerol dehydrogenase-like iron-containing ADH family enzyme|uniref:CRISPR type III-B/RAMP module-associated protein Cmr5 n=1 Tax=Kosmotoga olearia (strain ATCC BAA-1733 / DSM 21960 / TBF 19.5.1) TaxID=521045 RepID=C5CFA2_KOSOT|nr:hypothetical protein [Kosmotoga olearia]ACR79379.1 hypothetical protein Kole_0663 [Kosmotoga olearia TBF 19.5.1]